MPRAESNSIAAEKEQHSADPGGRNPKSAWQVAAEDRIREDLTRKATQQAREDAESRNLDYESRARVDALNREWRAERDRLNRN